MTVRVPVTQAEADDLLATVECPAGCRLLDRRTNDAHRTLVGEVEVGSKGGGKLQAWDACSACDGTGRVPSPDRPTHVTSQVPVAKGDEVVLVVACGECGGSGLVAQSPGRGSDGHCECDCTDGERVVARARAARHSTWLPRDANPHTVHLCDVQEAQA